MESSKEIDLEKIQAFDYSSENANGENPLNEYEQELAFLGLELEREKRSKKFLLLAWIALALATLTILTVKRDGIINETYRESNFPNESNDGSALNDELPDNTPLSKEEYQQLFGHSDTSYQDFFKDEDEEESISEEKYVTNEQDLPVPGNLQSPFGKLNNPYYPGTDLPFFWYIPKAGSTSIQEVFTQCYKLTAANNFGAYDEHGSEPVRSSQEFNDVSNAHNFLKLTSILSMQEFKSNRDKIW